MQHNRLAFAAVQLVGGVAVLGSYAQGLAAHPDTAEGLWGTIPAWAVAPYSACMPFAAAGYLVTAWFLWRRVPADHPVQRGLLVAYGALLTASALWMPMCFAALDAHDPSWLPWIQLDLAVTATATAALGAVLWRLRGEGLPGWRAAAVGHAALAWQTVVLDAVVWPLFFVV